MVVVLMSLASANWLGWLLILGFVPAWLWELRGARQLAEHALNPFGDLLAPATIERDIPAPSLDLPPIEGDREAEDILRAIQELNTDDDAPKSDLPIGGDTRDGEKHLPN